MLKLAGLLVLKEVIWCSLWSLHEDAGAEVKHLSSHLTSPCWRCSSVGRLD